MEPCPRAHHFGITVYGCEPDEAARFRALAPAHGAVPTLTTSPVSVAAVRTAPPHRCVSVGHKSAVAASTLRALAAGGVEYLSTRSIGLDHIDLAAAADAGIEVGNVAYAPDGVADFTLMLILMAVRGAGSMVTAAGRGDYRLPAARGRDLRDLTVGVVGAGRIGSAVVERLCGFGCRVLVHARSGSRRDGVHRIPLATLLAASDVVTLHVPHDPTTHHLVGRAELAAMKPGAILVNTSRGPLVDTAALVAALESGHLGGAAVDVLEGEHGVFYRDHGSAPPDHPWLDRLRSLPNVVVTPHTAYFTDRALHDTVEHTLVNCRNFERNRAHAQAQDRDLVRGRLGGA